MATLANLGAGMLGRRDRDLGPQQPASFAERFGDWDLINELLRRQVPERTLYPGEQIVDPLGFRGQRDPATGYYLLRRF